MTRPIGTAAELERRRRRAVSLLERGEAPVSVALRFGVHENSVYRWWRMAQSDEGLEAKPHFGPPPRLSDQQAGRLEQLLRQGAHRHGWPNARWTVARVTELILRHFGLHYHPEHVRKILKYRLNQVAENPDFKSGSPARQPGRAPAAESLCGV